MPEVRESETSGNVTEIFADTEPPETLQVGDIWADATEKERLRHPKGSPARDGHVYALESSSTILRGQRNSQTRAYPPYYAKKGPISEFKLRLVGVQPSPRNVILHFVDKAGEGNHCWAQVWFYLVLHSRMY